MILYTRQGFMVSYMMNPDAEDLGKSFAALQANLDAVNNPLGWKARAAYLTLTQIADNPTGVFNPVLVGNPLRPDGLAKVGIVKVVATIKVLANGSVADVQVKKNAGVPDELIPAVADALTKAVFAPALERGQVVDGTYEYRLEF